MSPYGVKMTGRFSLVIEIFDDMIISKLVESESGFEKSRRK